MNENKVVNKEKIELTNATHDLYTLLTTIFKNDTLKYTKSLQRLTFNSLSLSLSLSLFYIFYPIVFLFLIIFKLSCIKKHHVFNLYQIFLYFEFLLCNGLHSVRNMYWWRFFRGLFLLLFQTNHI